MDVSPCNISLINKPKLELPSPSGLRLVDLFPEAPSKVLEEKDSVDGGVDVEEDLFDALNQPYASVQTESKTCRPHTLTRWITM